jgi:serine/threonine protein kinase
MQIDNFLVDFHVKLGKGSYGEVYKGKDVRYTDRPVAVKKFQNDDVFMASAKREFKGLCKLHGHANVVKLYCQCIHEGDLYLVMEYSDRGDLEYFLKKENPGFQVKLNIMIDCASAVAYMHSQEPPIVHRDIKPQNILIFTRNQGVVAKICDFGVAKIFEPHEIDLMQTDAGTFIFRAPEVIEKSDGRLKYTKAVDTFSVGLVYQSIMTYKEGDTEINPKPGIMEEILLSL